MTVQLLLAAVVVLAVRGEKPSCEIAVGENPPPNVRYAAEELRDWTERLTGVRLPIVGSSDSPRRVALAVTVADPKRADEFRIRERDGAVTITGGKRGVIYGVYELLERFGGCRWYAADFEVVPRIDALEIPANLELDGKQAFRSRTTTFGGFYEHPEWAVRCRLTSDMPDRPEFGGISEYRTEHNSLRIVPPEKHFAEHPEYFAEIGGMRQGGHTEPCYSNPDVRRIVLEYFRALFAGQRAKGELVGGGLYHMDYERHCTCEKCRALCEREDSPLALQLDVLNEVAARLVGEFPDLQLKTSGYLDTRRPLRHMKAHPNVTISVAPIELDYLTPIAEGRYLKNRAFIEEIGAWHRNSDELAVFDYNLNYLHFTYPFPNLRAMAENMRFYRDNGVVSKFTQGQPWSRSRTIWFGDLKGYVAAKLMWNPDQDWSRLADEFIAAYYGKAAPFVRADYDAYAAYPVDVEKTPLYCQYHWMKMPYGDDILAASVTRWRQALAAVADEPDARIVEHVKAGLYMAEYNRVSMFTHVPAGRPVVLLRAPERTIDLGLRREMCALAKSVFAYRETHPKAIVTSSLGTDRERMEALRMLVSSTEGLKPSDRALLGNWAVLYPNWPPSLTTKRVDDPDALSGRAVRAVGSGKPREFACNFYNALVDNDARYRVRVRAKVDPATVKGAFAFQAGCAWRKNDPDFSVDGTPRVQIPAERATGRYEWYDLFVWQPNGGMEYVWIGPFGSTMSVDSFELVRVDGR